MNDKKFAIMTIEELQDLLKDLEKISVYNDDFISDDVALLRTMVDDLKTKVEDHYKEEK